LRVPSCSQGRRRRTPRQASSGSWSPLASPAQPSRQHDHQRTAAPTRRVSCCRRRLCGTMLTAHQLFGCAGQKGHRTRHRRHVPLVLCIRMGCVMYQQSTVPRGTVRCTAPVQSGLAYQRHSCHMLIPDSFKGVAVVCPPGLVCKRCVRHPAQSASHG
jgi:hypothetical protein